MLNPALRIVRRPISCAMRPVCAVLLLSLLSLLLILESTPSHAVIGGERMKLSMALTQYVVAITYKDENGESKHCTGGIIGSHIVLTAAHCVPKDQSTMGVVVGETIFHDKAVAVLPVATVRIHPLYEKSRTEFDNPYDLAVIKTRDPLPPHSRHLQLADRYFPVSLISKVYVIGYGVSGFDKKGQSINTGTLNAAIVTRAGDDDDEKMFRLDQTKGTGICVGDSGGPMLVQNAHGFIIMGLATTVFNAYDNKGPGVCSGRANHVSASYFRHWIMKQAFELMQVNR